MKSRFVFGFISLLAIAANSAFGLEVYDSGYTAEIYASYSNQGGIIRGLEFDSYGNLYVSQRGLDNSLPDGVINKIDTTGSASVFASGFYSTAQMAWGGGTAYGDYLYVADVYDNRGAVIRIDSSGNKSVVTDTIVQPYSMTIDRTGNYGGQMYVGNIALDHIWQINTSGTASMFSSFPDNAGGGGPYCLAIDPTGKYGGMFVSCSSENSAYNGIFKMDTSGNVSLFNDFFNNKADLCFGSDMFDNDLFLCGSNPGESFSIWHIDTLGNETIFASFDVTENKQIVAIDFGPDGAMYAAYNDFSTQTTNILRIAAVPEPCSIVLLGLSALMLRRRK